MTDINKFLSDMQKTLKHDRQNNGGKSSYDRVKNDLRRLFERNAALAFLENSDEYQELISDSDWEEFGRLVNFEAEDLDVGVLQDLMKILVSKGAY